MNARVRFFARLSEIAGMRETEVDVGEGLRVSDVFATLVERWPEMRDLEPSLLYAVNAEYVPPDHPVRPGDELALIPPVSGGATHRSLLIAHCSMLFELTPNPLDPDRVVASVRKDEAGAVALFYGVVRNENKGRRVLYLEYDAYPEMAEKVMREIADEIAAEWPVTAVAVQHRTGRLEIGETSLLVAVSSPHREEAFDACHAFVDRLKQRVPVWKKEVFEGGEEWIGREGTE